VPLLATCIQPILGWSGFVPGVIVEVIEKKKSRWMWSLSLMATTVAGAAVVVLRGCWHKRMSWPVRSQEYSYQVCLNCGIKRLFDEKTFRSYGPYSYDLERLISWSHRRETRVAEQQHDTAHRSAS